MAAYAIGVDIGGTFTDCFVTDGKLGWRGKAPTTPRALVDGLLAALESAAADAGRPLADVLDETTHFGLGTTAVTNCLAEHAGAPTGLLATRGFGDLWTMARGHRRGIDGMSHPLPTLVPRRRVAEVTERVDRDGSSRAKASRRSPSASSGPSGTPPTSAASPRSRARATPRSTSRARPTSSPSSASTSG
jgi:N-methylhydantoinase A/oxoprolinase/acetone carboxylase beta subunit